jgi:uncharacterized protein
MKFGLKKDTINKINAVFASHPDVEEVVIYGSRAKGSEKQSSDIDLTVKGNNLSLSSLNRIAAEIDDLLLPYTIDLSVYNQINNEDLLEHIERVGKIFYKKSSQ